MYREAPPTPRVNVKLIWSDTNYGGLLATSGQLQFHINQGGSWTIKFIDNGHARILVGGVGDPTITDHVQQMRASKRALIEAGNALVGFDLYS